MIEATGIPDEFDKLVKLRSKYKRQYNKLPNENIQTIFKTPSSSRRALRENPPEIGHKHHIWHEIEVLIETEKDRRDSEHDRDMIGKEKESKKDCNSCSVHHRHI